MLLETALDEFGLLLRRRHRGEEGRRAAASLAALREYLLDYCGHTDTAALRSQDLTGFLLDYYPAEEEPDAQVAVALLEACAGLALWLVERGERETAPFLRIEPKLGEDLARVIEALTLLKEHVRRDDLVSPFELTDDEGEETLGAAGTGLSRLARLDQVDYGAAQEDRFTVSAVDEDRLQLTSATRQALGEGAAGPVLVPAAAGARLRPGDTIHAEIAPGPEGWELLEVFGVRPGGYE